MRRALRRELDKPLARMLLGGEVGPGDTMHVDLEDGKLALTAESATDSAGGTFSEAPDAKSGDSAEA